MAKLEDEERRVLRSHGRFNTTIFRGCLGRMKYERLRLAKIKRETEYAAAVKIQACRRALVGRRKFEAHKELVMQEMLVGEATRTVQRVARGMLGRKRGRARRIERDTRHIQRVFRGRLGRKKAKKARAKREYLLKDKGALPSYATWRMRVGREEAMHRRRMERQSSNSENLSWLPWSPTS